MKKSNENRKQEATHNKSPKRDVKTPDKKKIETAQNNSPKLPTSLCGENTSPTITNIYRKVSTEERIRLYLKICRYVMNGEEI